MQEAKSYWPPEKEFSYSPGMDKARTTIKRRIDEEGFDLKALSLKMGKNHAYLQQFLNRGVPKKLDEDARATLAALIRVPESDLLPEGAPRAGGKVTPALPRLIRPSDGPQSVMVPVYGQGSAGRHGRFEFNGEKVDEIEGPPRLAGVPGAYAVRVVGESMVPRYYPGEAVFVHPNLPVLRGSFVVAQVMESEGAAPSGYIKRFLGQDRATLKLEQLNPKQVLTFPAKSVVSVHRIIMGGDG